MVEKIKKATGQVAEAEAKFKALSGAIETSSGKLSEFNAGLATLEGLGKIFGALPIEIVNFNETLKEASTLNEDFIKNLDKTRNAVLDLSMETSNFGVGYKEVLKATKEFSQENVKLLPIYRDNIKGLVDFSARLKAFGVDTKASAQLVSTLTTNLDMTADQLDTTRRTLVSFARQTGQSVQEVVSSYSKSIGSFMDFLDPAQMNQSFMQFQVMARRMGMEANKLYSIATQFDTIQGAQQMGARLNQTFSALGMEFNALALQEMGPRERMDYISKKTREALSRARNMGGREGRLIMRSLAASGLGDLQTIRALGAEGGGRGGTLGAISPVGRAEEAQMARRVNALNVSTATQERLNLLAFRRSKIIAKLNPLLNNFSEILLEINKRIQPKKEAAAMAIVDEVDKFAGAFAGRATDLFTMQAKIGSRAAQTLKNQGINATANTTIGDVLGMLGEVAGKAGPVRTAAGAGAGVAAASAAAGPAAAMLFTNQQVKEFATIVAREIRARVKDS